MSSWIERFENFLSITLRWIQRLYGVFFLALGMLLLYWAGRGLLAYQGGVRAAWSDPLASLAGLAAGVLSLWAGNRIVREGLSYGRLLGRAGVSRQLAQALETARELEHTDPAAARQVLDNHFMREAAATERRRAELRQRAPYDVDAALSLQKELREELNANVFARKEMLKGMSASERDSVLSQIDKADVDLEAELNTLEGAIERLRLR